MRRRWRKGGLTSHPTLFDPVPDITRRRHRADAASEDANRGIEPRKSEYRRRILDYLKRNPEGLTCKEVSSALGMGYTTVSGRLSELKRDRLVVVTGERREGAAVLVLGARPDALRATAAQEIREREQPIEQHQSDAVRRRVNMPHDVNGTELQVGDTVNIPCVVTEIFEGENYCNATLQTTIPMAGTTPPIPGTFALNTAQTELVSRAAKPTADDGPHDDATGEQADAGAPAATVDTAAATQTDATADAATQTEATS